MTTNDEDGLYLVHVEGGRRPDAIPRHDGKQTLSEGLFLVRTSATQSQLYHSVKRRTQPDALFVGRLDGIPKFKGMADGALKWVRQGGR